MGIACCFHVLSEFLAHWIQIGIVFGGFWNSREHHLSSFHWINYQITHKDIFFQRQVSSKSQKSLDTPIVTSNGSQVKMPIEWSTFYYIIFSTMSRSNEKCQNNAIPRKRLFFFKKLATKAISRFVAFFKEIKYKKINFHSVLFIWNKKIKLSWKRHSFYLKKILLKFFVSKILQIEMSEFDVNDMEL